MKKDGLFMRAKIEFRIIYLTYNSGENLAKDIGWKFETGNKSSSNLDQNVLT